MEEVPNVPPEAGHLPSCLSRPACSLHAMYVSLTVQQGHLELPLCTTLLHELDILTTSPVHNGRDTTEIFLQLH